MRSALIAPTKRAQNCYSKGERLLLEFGHQSGRDISFAGAVNPAYGSQYTLGWKYRRPFIEDRLCHRFRLAHQPTGTTGCVTASPTRKAPPASMLAARCHAPTRNRGTRSPIQAEPGSGHNSGIAHRGLE
jgi:hypothetical protein